MNSSSDANQGAIEKSNRGSLMDGLARVFYCDPRSLAVMRIGIGVLLILDLLFRSMTMRAMYTDGGIISLAEHADYLKSLEGTYAALSWSLHAWNGSLGWQIALFAIAGIAAAMLIVGYRTRLASIVSFILLASLHCRNPIILHSGDSLLRMVLFWSMFLPLGAVWSLDSRRRIANENELSGLDRAAVQIGSNYFSAATFGLVLTLFSLYFFSGISKLNHFWFSGEAMQYVLRLDIYATDIGKAMLQRPALLKFITWSTLVVEIGCSLLIFVPWKNAWCRVIAIVAFFALQIGIMACMDIGLFQLISIVVWMALLPSGYWDHLTEKTGKFSVAWIERKEIKNAKVPRAIHPVASGICVFLALYFLCWNIANIDHPACRKLMPDAARVVAKNLNLRQGYTMFDTPPTHSPWFVYEAALKNGTRIDAFFGKQVTYEKPESVRKTMPDFRWRRLHRNLVRPGYARFREPVARYVRERWNETHDSDSQIASMKTVVYLEEITSGQKGESSVTWTQFGQDTTFDDAIEKMKRTGIILP